jgi:hypothetical protein
VLEKFKEDEEVFDAIKRMYNKCEAIVVKKTAKGDIIPSLGIFILKAYHDLIETSKVNQEVTGKDGKDLFRNLSEEDINDRIQKLLNK